MKGSREIMSFVRRGSAAIAAMAAMHSGAAHAGFFDSIGYNSGKVLATPGVQMVDGAAGGGVTPWAVIGGYETRDGINGNFHYTYASLPNYSLNSIGADFGFFDRVELSYAYDVLPTGSTFDTVGLITNAVGNVLSAGGPAATALLSDLKLSGPGGNLAPGVEPFNTTIKMHVIGAKVRLIGEAIYDSDNLIPQVAVGGFYKINQNKDLLKTLQAEKSKDYEVYASVTKIFFPISTLINVTGRYTGANQTGLTGFEKSKQFRVEASLAYLLKKDTAIGTEFAQHGHALDGKNVAIGNGADLTAALNDPVVAPTLNTLGVNSGLVASLTQHESNWYDAFVALFPSKNLSLVLAVAYLGHITFTPNQTGFYLSAQASF